jgi:hypothetical protein
MLKNVNNFKVKGVNFYGAESEFIVSGSDCGRIFFWEKHTQQIVNYLKADDRGIVNVLEPHPNFPILATSGLDNDVKVWSPTAEETNKMEDYSEVILNNQRSRDSNRNLSLSSFEFELLLLLMNRPQNRVFYRTRVSVCVRFFPCELSRLNNFFSLYRTEISPRPERTTQLRVEIATRRI